MAGRSPITKKIQIRLLVSNTKQQLTSSGWLPHRALLHAPRPLPLVAIAGVGLHRSLPRLVRLRKDPA